MGFMFCNPTVSGADFKCASPKESIKYLVDHGFDVDLYLTEQYIDYEDYKTPFKLRTRKLKKLNADRDQDH